MTESASLTEAVPQPPSRWLTEVRLFLTAVMFYTRLPCPGWVGYSDDQLNRSTRYFPAIGWLVGLVVATVIGLAQLVLPLTVAVILGLAAGLLLTGAFHEDGLADVCDGFGGGLSVERRLALMKDSRVGVFAVLGLIVLFSLKITALTALIGGSFWAGLAGLVMAQVVSRWSVVTIIFSGTYARADLTSKIRPIGRRISRSGLVVASLWLLPFVALAWWHPWWLTAVGLAFLVRLGLAGWFNRRLGGYTGDCLGAAQQIIETVIILVCLGWAGAGW
ncbi:MAG: adenosylcobinamide-GDP ribazoletransferase [Propionibacteriaceae bacterium]|jgi:adenosylcobinamide-GDP ribazoletransferase|nr:adenosylcobinamide-GDP ribazoletransferase [Propionibacteriaceae bacterium]